MHELKIITSYTLCFDGVNHDGLIRNLSYLKRQDIKMVYLQIETDKTNVCECLGERVRVCCCVDR